jgi:hypothetical protein
MSAKSLLLMTPANTVIDYYRCPEDLASFEASKELSPESGFFCVADGLIVYGQLANARPAEYVTSALPHAILESAGNRPSCIFPFDPNQVVENLRRERYRETSKNPTLKSNWTKKLVRDSYYLIRPLLPVSARKHLQRASLRNWNKIPFPHWPVDFTVELLHRALLKSIMQQQKIEQLPFIWFWPDELPACAIMTHDVEAPAGYDFCETLMDLNDSFGIKSSFQVVPEDRYQVQPSWLNHIRERGFEINVHDLNHDGHLFDEKEEFLRRARKINNYAKDFGAAGFRAGVLYRNQEWFNHLEFEYDMSVPNVGHLDPQRGGCCTVMPYCVGNLVELPVTCIQDYSLFNILQQYSTTLWQTQIEDILSVHGMASFIIHPDYVIDQKARDIYAELLAILARLRKEARAWIALPVEVARWWKHRSQMYLIRRGDSWSIAGPSSERARVAYARIQDGQLIYQFN